MPEMLSGYLVVETMKRLGVEYIFGMPGFQHMSIYDGLYQSRGIPRHILIHDEKCGAFMAYGYSKISGKPGVCDATVGPGATNLVSGVAEAYYASTALVAVTSDVRMEFVGKSPNQECDQISVFRPIVKRTYTVHVPQRIIESTAKAFFTAASGRPGPVHLNLPENINYTPVSWDWEKELSSYGMVSYPMDRPRPDAASIDRAVSMLRKAKRPVCIAGGGIHLSRANQELTIFVEKTGIPVATSLTGKGAIPENHPLALSLCGRFDRYANQFIQQADLILAIGTKLGELVTSRWSVIPKETPIIHIDVDGAEMGRNYVPALGIVADARSAVNDLIEAWGPEKERNVTSLPVAQEIALAKTRWEESVRRFTDSIDMPTTPARIIAEIQRFMPADGLLVVDGGLATHWAGLFYDVCFAGRGFLPNRGQAAIGCGFPAAMGAKVASPNRAVVAFIGDGGFCQNIAELETAARERIPVIVVVNNNSCLGYVKTLQHTVFDQRYKSVDFTPLRFDRIAEDFGCRGVSIKSIDQIVPALRNALDSGEPAVLDIPTVRDPGQMLPKADARTARC